ncbi:thioesterase II family protein [Nannocystaceae bacterium ST9]
MSARVGWIGEARIGEARIGEDQLPLLCFPHAGGGGVEYRHWARSLPGRVAVWPVALPGREARLGEPAIRRVGVLIDAMVEALADHLDRPYALFGHSMGAVLAFEFARGMRRIGAREPVLLAVSGRRAPTLAESGERVVLHDRPDEDLLDHLRRLAGTPTEVLAEPALQRLILPTLRADFEMLETWAYVPELPLDCPIHAFAGREDPVAPTREVARWRELTLAEFELCELPGDHFFLRPQAAALLARLADALATR